MTPEWMLQALLAAALLGLGALAAERVAGWFGVPRRAAWVAAMLGSLLLPVLSLLAPGLVPDPGIFPVAAAPVPTLDIGTLPSFAGAPPAPTGGVVVDAPAWWTDPAVLLGLGWLAASLAVLGLVGWTYGRLRRARERGVAMDLDGGEVRVTEHVGPAVVGLVHPAVVVPRWVLEASAEERRLVLLHEREHVAAGDAWLLFLGTLAVAAMPWSLPLWWQHRRLRAAAEADCDARVLARGASRRAYGQVLIRTAGSTSGLPLLGPAWGDSTSQLERRIMTMTARPPSHRLLRSLPLLALAAAVAATACDVAAGAEAEASRSAEPASLRAAVEARLGADDMDRVTDTVRVPPPAPPAPPLPEPSAVPAPLPPPDALAPLAAPPPDRSVPPALAAPPAPGARPASAAPRAATTARQASEARQRVPDTTRIITDTMAATPDPSRPRPKASTGFEQAFPIRITGSGDQIRTVDYLRVARVRSGTGAARAGIQPGDEILAVNGLDGKALRSWVALVTQEPGTRYVLRIRRGTQVREVDAVLDPITSGKPLW
jgi:hypothetical protein